ncbi:MAG TPA: CPBP family intramembrane glutamic endopeptidase [Propionibacteriaceae bacterium]|nr:CPBP family intramembrane glutamic endopeptidase [Propionibacteriaceae bacterium]
MTSNPSGDGFTRGFDQVPPEAYEPDPALAGYPPPQPTQLGPASYSPTAPHNEAAQQPYGVPNLYPPRAPFPQPPLPQARRVSALPDGPRPYQQMLRGPLYRWWKPLLCLVLMLLLAAIMMAVAVVPVIVAVIVAGLIAGAPDLVEYTTRATTDIDIANLGPVGFIYLNLTLIVLIPASGLSIWIVHGVRPRYLSSVAGGIRWRWLLRCVAVLLPVWGICTALPVLVEPATSPRPEHWVALLLIVVFMTPLQAAGEEYFFRGWIMQNVGAWFARPMVGLVASLIVSAVAFSTAHLSPDPWVLGTIACLAVASGLAAWRTGGLEAGIAMHAVNNVLSFFVVVLFGGWSQAFVGRQTTGTPMMLVLALAVNGIALWLILWQAKRIGLQPYFQPREQPVRPPGYPSAPAYPLGRYPAP